MYVNLILMGFPWALVIAIVGFEILRRKKIRVIADSVIKAVIGYYLVVIGASITPYSTSGLQKMMQALFQCSGGIMNTETYFANLFAEYGQTAVAILFLSFSANVLLARISRMKGVYLTAHHLLYLSLITSAVFTTGTELPAYAIVVIGAVCTSVFAWLCVATARPILRRVTGDPCVSMAHSNIGAVLIGAGIGNLMKKNAEHPPAKKASQIKSIPGIAAATVFIVYLIMYIMLGADRSAAILGNVGVMGILKHSVLYGAQIALLLYGIRMLLSPVIEIFWDISHRFVPNMWKGLDASILIGYQPDAWYWGFAACCIGGWIGTVGLLILHSSYVPIMSPMSAYFTGGVAGVCGYKLGSRRACVIAGFISGIVTVALIAVTASTIGVGSESGIVFGEAQYGLFAMILRFILRLFS